MREHSFSILDHIEYKEALNFDLEQIERAFAYTVRAFAPTATDKELREDTLNNLFSAYAFLAQRKLTEYSKSIELYRQDLDEYRAVMQKKAAEPSQIKDELESLKRYIEEIEEKL